MKIHLWVIIGAIVLNSCDEENKNDFKEISSYPTSIGNEWNYNRSIILKVYESETSENVIKIDTFNFLLKVKVEKDTVLNDTMIVKQFTSQTNDNNWKSKSYCFQDSEGLKTYAYSNAGGIDFPKKTAKRNVPLNLFSVNIFDPVINEDELIFYYSPPVLNIKFPLFVDSKWTYIFPSETFNLQIDKEVSGCETLNINNHSYSCYKISWNYSGNDIFATYKVTDWISEVGLIKRQSGTDRVLLTDFEGDSTFFGQVIETILLNDLKIY